MAIPQIIHHLWKDDAVPERYRSFRAGWEQLHPGWEKRLWTDRDLLALVERDYPGMADVYREFPLDISRADLGRYLVLHRFGGVYADLDCECLKPVGPLIEDAGFVIGLEPKSHAAHSDVAAAGLGHLLCPSFIASEPGHDFWRAVLKAIVEVRGAGNPLDATGPFLLTRAFDRYPDQSAIRLASAEAVYPVDKFDCWNGRVHDIEFRERATRDAYMLHYWDGGWFRGSVRSTGLPTEIKVVAARPSAAAAGFDHGAIPKISCLMICEGALEPAQLAIDAFLGQTYTNKELVIAARAPERRLLDHLRALGRAEVRLAPAEPTAGVAELHDLALRLAEGALVCRWEEGDLHDPMRLDIQYQVLKQTDAHACLLRRWMDWDPEARRLGVVDERPLATSLLCLKSVAPRGSAWAGDGDDPTAALPANARVTLFDLTRLIAHPSPVGGMGDKLAVAFEGERYGAVLTELAKRLPVEARLGLDSLRSPAAEVDVEVRLFGHFSAAIGLGASARGTAAALAAAGVAFTVTDIPMDETHPEPIPVAPPQRPTGPSTWRVNLVNTNPDALALADLQGRSPFTPADREAAFTIGLWAWETATGVPPYWPTTYPNFDEIWTPSVHAASAIGRNAPVPVMVMPHVVAPPAATLDRTALELPPDAFIFLFAFDATSNVDRKNPAGLIEAYRAAFPAPSADVLLIIKAKKLSPETLAQLTDLAGGRDDIRIIAEPWPAERMFSLMAACDCYVSLHRAEGFGLTMAEAMYFGKPVIATAYSGNVDFMSPETAYLVPYRLIALEVASGVYGPGSVWAEPDLAAAAALMVQVAANREEAACIGARASAWVRTHLSADAVGRRMARRLGRRRFAKPRVPATSPTRSPDPTILILTPVKDARAHLPRYFDLLRRLDYDRTRLSLAMLEGDSRDGTYEALVEALPSLRADFGRVEISRFDYRFHIEGARWTPSIQRRRREVIARSRNRLLSAALGDEEWVLWLDVDLTDYPPSLLRDLLASGKDIVTPHCVRPDGLTFDLNTFRFSPESGGRDHSRHLVDGLFQPPRGAGRLYLDAFQRQDIVPVDAVGGTALLIRADLHREGLTFPPHSYRGYIETEGLAMMARDMGYDCWALPQLRVVHS